MQALRLYHLLLAALVAAAFVSSEAGLLHAWLGYGVAGLIALRLMLGFAGRPQLGLSRFYPQFQSLRLGTALTHPAISRSLLLAIALCLLAAVGTGLAMDKGAALGLAPTPLASPPSASAPATPRGEAAGEEDEHGEGGEGREGEESPMGEAHELFSNLLMGLVAAHVGYLLLFKRPLARYMLFLPQARGVTSERGRH